MSTLLSWAFGASVLILAVLALRFLLKNKLSARWRYALWAVVLARLLVPLQIPLPLPAFLAGLTPELPYQMNYSTVSNHPRVESPEEFVSTSQTYLEDGTAVVYTHTRADGTTVTTTIPILTRYQVLERRWGASALLAGAVLLAANGTFYLRLRKRRRPLEIPDCPLPVYAAEGLPSPCLFGLFRPAVYLTPEAAALPEEQRRHILAHELTHHAHRDHIWSVLRCAALALHWYNPLVWLAAALSKADGELACDEGAVARLGESERIPYGRTLIGLSVRGTRPADLLQCSTAMTGGKDTLRNRVAALARKPETRKTALFAAASLLALAAVFTFAGRAEQAHPNYADFRFQLRQAQAIRFTPPLFSSSFYPDPITDDDLLEEAKTVLGTAHDLLNVPEKLDPSDAEFISASVTLVNTERDLAEDNTYLLYRWNDKTYVLVQDDSRYIPIVVMDASAGALNSIARRQWERNMDTPKWRETVMSSALRSVTEIQFQFRSMDAVYPAITDPDLLERAAEVLRSGDPQDGTWQPEPDLGGAQVSIRDENGGRLADYPLSNGEMVWTLYELTMEQQERNEKNP